MISVVVPSYNYEKYLPQAIESVAFQTYEDIELVIIDDASSDSCPELIKQLEKQYSGRFSGIKTMLRSENKGAHYTINEGIEAASGKYISILNADDMFEANRFVDMMRKMGNARMAFSAVKCIDLEGKPLKTTQAQQFEQIQAQIAGKRFMALAAAGENIAISTGNMLFEKTLFYELGGFKNYKYVHDYDFFLRTCLKTEPVFVEDTAYLYRLHGENSFTKLAKEGLRENRMLWLDIYGKIKRGEVQNAIMQNGDYDYIEEFCSAVAMLGKKKELLWKLAGNPLIKGGVGLLKSIYKV